MDRTVLQQELLAQLLPLVGGEANVTRKEFRSGVLHVTLKDQGLAQLEALQGLDGVTGAELSRGRLKLTLTEPYFEEEKQMATDNKQIASDVLAAVGGKENVTMATHCMTRLRLNLKDMTLPNEEEVKKINGVIGVVQAGGQFQIIIGQNVTKVYDEFCKLTGLAAQAAIEENLDGPKEKLTLKKIGNNILNYISGSMTPLLPILMAAGLLKTVLIVFSDLLHIVPADSDFYTLLNFIYDAGFYFIPIFLGYHAAKKIGMTPVLGMYIGAVLIAPAFIAMIGVETPFTIFGLAVRVKDYSKSILPILLTVATAYPIEKLFKKIIPDALSTIFVPTLTMFLVIPIALLVTAPAGDIIAGYLGTALQFIADNGGFFGVTVITALFEYLIMTGMHLVLLAPAMMNLAAGGTDQVIFVAAKVAGFATFGMALGTFLRMKHKREKSAALGYFISGLVGGVTEPSLYGVGLKYKRPLIAMTIGAAAGGAFCGLTHVTVYMFAPSNFLGILAFSGANTANMVCGIIGCLISLIVTTVLVFMFCYNKSEIETGTPRNT